MKSVCCSGTKPFLVRRPLPKPAPSSPPEAIAAFDTLRFNWVGLNCAADLSPVDWSAKLVSRSSWYAWTLPVTTAAPTSDAAEQEQHDDVHGLEAGNDEHRRRADHDHEHRAEVVLGVDERHDESREPDRHGDPPGVEIAPVLMAVARDRDHDHDLGDLRRLELERPDLEPRLRAAVVAAEYHHTREQRQHAEIEDRPRVADAAVVDRHDHTPSRSDRARRPHPGARRSTSARVRRDRGLVSGTRRRS